MSIFENMDSNFGDPLLAGDVMSAPVHTITPETTALVAQQILLRYGHSGLPVIAIAPREIAASSIESTTAIEHRSDHLIGIISRRDLEIAIHHGFGDAAVKGLMTTTVRTINSKTPLAAIIKLMTTYDVGRLPVIGTDKMAGQLVGIVTRTDVLRGLGQHQNRSVLFSNRLTSGELGVSRDFDLDRLRSLLAPQQWKLLTKAAQISTQFGWQLYLVGGAVRDLLLADPTTSSLTIQDIDLVVDGFDRSADVGAGVKLAQALQQLYPAVQLDIHGAFQTAALRWLADREFNSLAIDIATARTEFYAYPAANPEVEASSIRQDLYRRDFTINAMALRLTPGATAPLLDFFDGVGDLQSQQIRCLHPNSFIEDPTRIFRGARFAVRLGFEIETQTAAYIRYAIESGIYQRTARSHSRTPALQTRLKTELKYLFQVPYWRSTLELLASLGALQCIHSSLKLDAELLRQLCLVDRCWHRFESPQRIISWQLKLELMLAVLPPIDRQPVAKNLQLSAESIVRLSKLELVETDLKSSLSDFQQVSTTVKLLKQYDWQLLILIGVRCQPKIKQALKIRQLIWQYFTSWRDVQPILTGDDLRDLGCQPGPQYRQILDHLLAATLDREITDRAGAEVFLQRLLDQGLG
jgi:tRNA nucleotidyltransferase (CCA-adding enzyme)